MKGLCFLFLCDRLQEYELRTYDEISVREMIVIFVYTISAALSNRQMAKRFQRSDSTISVCFHIVLDVVQLLAKNIIKPDDP